MIRIDKKKLTLSTNDNLLIINVVAVLLFFIKTLWFFNNILEFKTQHEKKTIENEIK